jgi:HAD superfamily hydrolase (TIGR01509 family)
MGRVKAASLDAVTIDAYGTLLTVVDPLPSLEKLLPTHDPASIENAFRTEAAYYHEHAGEGRTAHELTLLHERSVAVFNDTLGSTLSPSEYVGAFEFEQLPGVRRALQRLRALGLSLAVVANWDITLHDQLETAGIAEYFSAVVPAARKPAPDGILRALELLGVGASRAVHIGDSESDERAALAAGLHFLPAPLPDAVAAIA